MALSILGEKLRGALERFRSATVIDKELVREAVKDLQRALISADVPVDSVLELSRRIEREVMKEFPKGLTRREHAVKVTHGLLAEMLGGAHEPPKKPGRILLAGLYGFGKTTTVGKLAKYYSNRGMRVAVICADTYRPAAYEQLKQVVSGVGGVRFYGNPEENKASAVVKDALGQIGKEKPDVVICDSSGRSALDKALAGEMKGVASVLAPDQTWLVVGADLGQLARKQAEAFHKAIGVNGIIITRMDGSAKGGGALAACAITGAPVYFIGTGEKIDDLEEFDATRYLGRLMGYGDLKGLLEKAGKLEVSGEDIGQMMKGEFNLKMFYAQLKAARQMGPLGKIMEMAGLGAQLPKEQLEMSEEKLGKFGVIMDSMTAREKLDPEVLNRNRIARVAKGSGCAQEEVRELIRNYKVMKGLFRKVQKFSPEKMGKKGFDMGKLMQKFGAKKKRAKIR